MKKKIEKRLRTSFAKGSIFVGSLAIISSRLIYSFVENDWLYQSNQEILGFGLILLFVGIFFLISGRKVNI